MSSRHIEVLVVQSSPARCKGDFGTARPSARICRSEKNLWRQKLVETMHAHSKIRVGRWLVYGIIDPRGNILIYVGKTHKRREVRLREHIDRAREGGATPIYQRIRIILEDGFLPEIFVLARVPPDGSWQDEERSQIRYWKNIDPACLPIIHPPQTRKSQHVLIQSVELLNVRGGG